MALDFGKLNFSVSFNPTAAFPLDARSYFESLEAAQAAAASAMPAGDSTTVHYYGETVCVVADEKATLYIIQPDKSLKEVGSVPTGDGLSIDVADGKVQIHGFGKEYYKYVPPVVGESGEVTEPSRYEKTSGFKAGLEPRVILKGEGPEYEIAWYEPSSETIEGVSSKVETLNKNVESLQSIVSGPSTGLVDKVSAAEKSIQELKSNKADQSALTALTERVGTAEGEIDTLQAGIKNVYTKEEANSAIASAIAKAPHLKRKVVESLPEEGADENTIYMVHKGPKSLFGDDTYDEYMYIDGQWELLGNSQVDLTDYAKKEAVTKEIGEAVQGHKGEVDAALKLKADKTVVDGHTSSIEKLQQGLAEKAADSELKALQQVVNGKAEKSELSKYATTEALSSGLNGKVDKREDADLLLNTDKAKLDALKVEGGAVKVEAANVNGLGAWVTSQRDSLAGLLSAEKEGKLAGIQEGAQVNILESIKIEGQEEALTISEKAVTIPMAAAEQAGLVKLSSEIGVNSTGALEVKTLSVSKLTQGPEESLILNGGNAATK